MSFLTGQARSSCRSRRGLKNFIGLDGLSRCAACKTRRPLRRAYHPREYPSILNPSARPSSLFPSFKRNSKFSTLTFRKCLFRALVNIYFFLCFVVKFCRLVLVYGGLVDLIASKIMCVRPPWGLLHNNRGNLPRGTQCKVMISWSQPQWSTCHRRSSTWRCSNASVRRQFWISGSSRPPYPWRMC